MCSKQFLLVAFLALAGMESTWAQCPYGLAPDSTNIVANGDFSAGNVSFTSDYDYCNTAGCMSVSEETYTVGTTPSIYNAGFTGVDHTTGTGNFLIVNGSTTSNRKVWCQTVSFDPNSYYIIDFWVSNLFGSSPASIQLYVNGSPFFSPVSAPPNTGTWAEFNQTFQSGLLYSTEVCLYDMNVDATSNDFGIDDISITKCTCDIGINAGPDQSICVGDSVQLVGTGSASYFWSPTNSLSCFTCSSPYASPSQDTYYSVSVNGPGGCTAIDSVLVTVFQHFDLGAGPDTAICAGASVQLHAAGAVSYSWQPSGNMNNANSATPLAMPAQSTTYYVNATDVHGCSQRDSAAVQVFPPAPPFQISSHDDTICLGGYAEFHLQGAQDYSWSPADYLTCATCDNVVANPPASITYTITATDSNGCTAGSDTAHVEVNMNCSYALVPSAFSPNGDGKNDYFHAVIQGATAFELKLYNRWGQLLFSTTNPNEQWDGRVGGKEQPVGVYIYTLKATLADGTDVNKNGNVTLVR